MVSIDEGKDELFEHPNFEGEAATDVVGQLGGGCGQAKGGFGTLVREGDDGGDE